MTRIIRNLKLMRQAFRTLTLSLLVLLTMSPVVSASPIQSSGSAPPPSKSVADQCTKGFLGLEPWFKFLPDQDFYTADANGHDKCDIKCFNLFEQSAANDCGNTKSDLPLVLLAIIDDLLRIAGLITFGFVLYGAFQFTTSQGSPDTTAKARNTIINALLGLALASIAIAAVSFLGNTFGAGT